MKKIFVYFIFMFGIMISSAVYAIEDKKSIAVFTLNTPMQSSSYSIYSNTQDMYSGSLVNALMRYSDIDVVDVNTAEQILISAKLQKTYEQMTKQYKQRYVLDYDKLDQIAAALGVKYIVFVHGGFDTQKSFLKSNWKYRCQWIWANPVKSSAQLNLNTTLIDVAKRRSILDENITKDIAMDIFQEPSQSFAENSVAIAKLKKTTNTSAIKIAKKIHLTLYPNKKTLYSEKDTFIERVNQNKEDNINNNYNNQQPQEITVPQETNTQYELNNYNHYNPQNNYSTKAVDSVNNARKDSYKKWIEQKL